jgi:hypothetical protein
MNWDETKCPWCRCFYPTEAIDEHKRNCNLNPQNK